MKTNSRLQTIRAAVFYGALWGTLESTVGALLHLLPLHIGFLFWMPLAAACMLGAARRTGSSAAALGTAFVCATLKLTDLFLPVRPDKVIHPALSILLEGFAFFALLTAAKGFPKRRAGQTAFIFAWNTAWRCLNLLALSLEPEWLRDLSMLSSAESVRNHLLRNNVLSSLTVLALLFAWTRRTERQSTNPLPLGSPLLPALMCACSLLLRRCI